jgi:hypothetical protein
VPIRLSDRSTFDVAHSFRKWKCTGLGCGLWFEQRKEAEHGAVLCMTGSNFDTLSSYLKTQFVPHRKHTLHRITDHLTFKQVVHKLLCGPAYATPCVDNLTEEKFCVCLNFPPAYEYRKCVENRI